jgi:hypothetical protein
VFEQAKTFHASDRATTVIGPYFIRVVKSRKVRSLVTSNTHWKELQIRKKKKIAEVIKGKRSLGKLVVDGEQH